MTVELALGRDWSEVASELPGRSKQQCKERYRLTDTVASLTQVHRDISFHNATRQTLPTSAKLTSLSMYDIRNDTTQCM
jgi:hypothetical protein